MTGPETPWPRARHPFSMTRDGTKIHFLFTISGGLVALIKVKKKIFKEVKKGGGRGRGGKQLKKGGVLNEFHHSVYIIAHNQNSFYLSIYLSICEFSFYLFIYGSK